MPLYEKDALLVREVYPYLTDEEKVMADTWNRRYFDQQDEYGLPHFPTEAQQEQERTKRYRSMFTDLRKMDELAPSLKQILPWSATPDDDRARVANINFLARQYGKPIEQVGAEYELFKMDWLLKAGEPTEMRDAGLYALAKKQVEKEAKTEQVTNDGYKAGVKNALKGMPSLRGIQEMQQTLAPEDVKDAIKGYMIGYEETLPVAGRHRDLVRRTIGAMSRYMDGGGSTEDEKIQGEMMETLLKLPGKERRLLLNALRLEAEPIGKAKGEEKGNAFSGHFWQQLGESAFRIGKGMGASTASVENALATVPTSGVVTSPVPQITTLAEAQAFVDAEVRHDIAQVSTARAAGGTAMVGPLPKFGEKITLTPEAGKLIQQVLDREERKIRLSREWSGLEQGVDPVVSTTANLFGSTGAILTLTAATRGAALPFLAEGYANLEYDKIRQENPTMPVSAARAITALSGAGQAALDRIGIKFFDKIPGLKSIWTNGISKVVVSRFAPRFIAVNSAEAGIEVAQDLATPVIQSAFAALQKEVPGYDWNREKGFIERYKEHWATMIPLTMIFGGVSSFQEYAGIKDIIRLNNELGALGVIEADRLSITDALRDGDTAKADALMKEANARRDPAIAAEFGDKLAAQNMQAGETFEAAQRLGLMPNIQRDREGYIVRDTDGNMARFSDWAQARAAVQSHFNDIEMQSIDAVARMADHFLATSPDGLQESLEISPGTESTLASRVAEGRMTPEEAVEAAIIAGELEGMTREESMRATFSVLGDNVVEQKENVRRSVSRVMKGGNVLTAFEEPVEGRWKAGLESGRYTRDQGIRWVRLAESVMGEKLLPEQGEISPRALTEAISKIVVADVFGRRKDGSRLPAGVVTQGVRAAAAKDAASLGAFLRAFRAFFGQVFSRARALRKARAEGKLTGEWESMLDDLLGIDGQQRYEREAEAEGQSLADEWVDEGDFDGYVNQTTDDATFSLRPRVDSPEFIKPSKVPEVQTIQSINLPQGSNAQAAQAGRAWLVDNAQSIIARIPAPFVLSARGIGKMKQVNFERGESAAAHFEAVSALPELLANSETVARMPDKRESENVAYYERRYAWAVFPDGKRRHVLLSVRYLTETAEPPRMYSLEALEVRDATEAFHDEEPSGQRVPSSAATELDSSLAEFMAGVKPEHREGGDVTHSLRAIRPGEAIDQALSSRLKAPEQRITFFARARDRLAKLSLDSLTWRGDFIEGTDSLEQRDAAIASLEKERRFRQRQRQRELRDDGMAGLQPGVLAVYQQDLATLESHPLVNAMLNDHGRLMSRTQAEKQGKLRTDGTGNAGDYDSAPWLPPAWYSASSGIMPDVMAQNLYDDGILNQATTEALWAALGQVITGTRGTNEAIREARAAVRKVEQDAYRQSMDEANQWFNQAVKDIPTAHEKMMAAFRTMDAILSAFPPEVRGKVGGYTKLASLKSDKARLKHMLDRIEKLDAELEKHLQKEIRDDLETLFDKAKPTGGKGEKAGGKIGVEGHRVFKAIAGMVDMDADAVTRRIDEISAAIEQETDLAKIGAMLEEQQLLELFGGLNAKRADKSWLKSAAELESAWNFAAEVYLTGRNKWKAQLEARLAEVADLRKQHIAAMGGLGTDARLSAIRAKAGKNDGAGLSLLSLVQVLERAYGTTHPLVRRWYGAARKATAAKGDAILAVRHEFADMLKEAIPGSSSIEREKAVFDLKTQQTVIAPKVEGVSVKEVDIPLETAVKLVTGEASLKAFGLEDHHRDELQAALDEHQAEGSQRESVTVQVVESQGMQADVPLTPMQAVHITMLWAQEMYRPGMERHGWTQETMDAIEEQLPPLAVQIRAFLASKYDAGYDAMNRVYQRMYGIDLPKVANYAPGTFMHEGQEIESDPFGQGLIQNGGVRAGFVRQRKQHMARPKWDSDALSLFFSHTANVEHWKAFAELGREMRSVLLSAESKAATEAQKGKAMEDILGKWVEIIERGGLETAKQGSAMDKLARRIGSNRSIIALAYNLGTLMKQSTALFGAMIRMPVAAYGRGFMRLFAGRLPVRDIFRQDFIQRRIQSGYSPEARAAMAQLWDAPPSRRRHLLQQGMELIGFVDGVFTTGTAAIAYDYHYRQGIQAGLTPQQARGEALAAAEDVVSRVAQPSETIDKSAFEIGAGAWGRLGFMFASDARQKWALLQEAVINRKQDPASLRRVAAFHLAAGVAIQTISAAWRDARDSDDDEVFDAKNWNPWSFLGGVILGPFAGVPLIGGALDTFSGRGELIEAAASMKDIATGKGDMKDVATTLSGLAYLGTLGKYEDAATFLAVSAKVAKDILGLTENAVE